MYEHKTQPLLKPKEFYQRMLKNLLFACSILAISLILGIVGYHETAGSDWIDSLHNASMILSGMGPVIEIRTTAGKLFSSFYALFSGIVFISNIGIILAPAIHRLIHRLHLQENATS